MKYLAPHNGMAIFIVIVIVISSLLFGCTKQKLEPMTNIWVSPCYIPGWLYNEKGEYLHVVYDDAYYTKDASPVTADSTMEILEESTWLAGVSATTPSYQIPDTGKLRFEVTVENASMRVESDEVFVLLKLKSETDDQWLELTTTGFRLKGKVTSYNARGYFKQAVFPSIDEFYYDLAGGQESDLRVYWQDNTLRIVSESPGEVTLHLRDLKDTYQFPAGGCVITDFADGKIIVQ